jgi:hypothetical protein
MKTTVHERRIWLRAKYGTLWWKVDKDVKKERHAEADLTISLGENDEKPKFDKIAKQQQEAEAWAQLVSMIQDFWNEEEQKNKEEQKNNIVERIKADWEDLRDTYLDDDWKLVWGNAKKCFGGCCPERKTIRMSEWLAVKFGYDEAWDTLTHEIAHGVIGDEFTKDGRRLNHGPKWKELHKLMDGSGKVSVKC